MGYRLFLDDERDPPNDGQHWIVLRDYETAIYYMANVGFPDFMSFDHDLGEGGSGLDVALWMVESHLDHVDPVIQHANPLTVFPKNFAWRTHSMNPVGAANIDALMSRFHKWLQVQS